MDNKTRFIYQVLLGATIIGGTVFLAFRYLWRGSPLIKVLALGLIVAVSYLVVDYLNLKNKDKQK